MLRWFVLSGLLISFAGHANAHASEQGFVLLLPTGMYIFGGVISVVLTILLVFALPPHIAKAIFHSVPVMRAGKPDLSAATSCVSFILLVMLLAAGWIGPHDPTRNPLPLGIWTLFWVGFVTMQGVFGNFWRWLNPWTGPYAIVQRLRLRPVLQYPVWLGHWPALLSFFAISAVLLAHPAPADPDNLALMVASYWVFHFAGLLIFGPEWLRKAEGLTVLLENYASISLIGIRERGLRLGISGWKVLRDKVPGTGLAVFMISTLAVGSFDGLNETFWWYSFIGINPLEFPGRTAVIAENLIGLSLAIPALVAVYGFSVWTGVLLIRQNDQFLTAFRAFAPAILPIALAYHFAHYLPGFLVEIQYVARAIANALQLRPVVVTTGFFNTLATVKVIWLSQAGAVVTGHVLAILLSHVLALRLFGSHKKAAVSQVPLALFMIAYTFFGLWLLASPKGG